MVIGENEANRHADVPDALHDHADVKPRSMRRASEAASGSVISSVDPELVDVRIKSPRRETTRCINDFGPIPRIWRSARLHSPLNGNPKPSSITTSFMAS